MNKQFFLLPVLLLTLFTCTKEANVADMVLTNGTVYTVDENQVQAEAVALKGNKIAAIGTAEEIAEWVSDSTEVIDLQGKFVMPGFIEGHGHFSGLGSSLMNLNFLKAKTWSEIVAMVAEKAKTAKPGEWITGRGWHQEKWTEMLDKQVLGYPYHDDLSSVTPNNPVILRHASGHGLIANAKAMELAGITAETPNPAGGEIVRDSRGAAIGVFEETAMRLINSAYGEYLATLSEEEKKEQWLKGIQLVQNECLSKGITSFQDAGASYEEIKWYKELAEAGKFDMRLWAMLRHSYEEMKGQMQGFPIIGAGNDFFTCRAIKSALDGALGSYGAWLLESYVDKANFVGQNTVPVEEVRNIAKLAFDHGMQFCVHAIGDRGNRETLDIFESSFAADPSKKDLRWRVEHAQHLHPSDIPRFKQLGVIASMQGVHCTSDAPFVVKRLGEQRAREGAYPWRSLLDAGAVVTNGTDAPVEDVDAISSFYASVTRKRPGEVQAFFPEQKMTRQEGIYSYTMACAYAAFEENIKGSITPGKLADLVVLSNNLMDCPEEEILNTKVLMTIVDGKIKYSNL